MSNFRRTDRREGIVAKSRRYFGNFPTNRPTRGYFLPNRGGILAISRRTDRRGGIFLPNRGVILGGSDYIRFLFLFSAGSAGSWNVSRRGGRIKADFIFFLITGDEISFLIFGGKCCPVKRGTARWAENKKDRELKMRNSCNNCVSISHSRRMWDVA